VCFLGGRAGGRFSWILEGVFAVFLFGIECFLYLLQWDTFFGCVKSTTVHFAPRCHYPVQRVLLIRIYKLDVPTSPYSHQN
jgi:hypothetical protein